MVFLWYSFWNLFEKTNKQSKQWDWFLHLSNDWETRRQRHGISTGIRARTKISPRKRGSLKEELPSSRRRRVAFLPNTRPIYRTLSDSASNSNRIATIVSQCFTSCTTASNCHNFSEVYEEREYRCLGKFADLGLTYTRTRSVATSWVTSVLSVSSSTMENSSSKRLANISNVMWFGNR